MILFSCTRSPSCSVLLQACRVQIKRGRSSRAACSWLKPERRNWQRAWGPPPPAWSSTEPWLKAWRSPWRQRSRSGYHVGTTHHQFTRLSHHKPLTCFTILCKESYREIPFCFIHLTTLYLCQSSDGKALIHESTHKEPPHNSINCLKTRFYEWQ